MILARRHPIQVSLSVLLSGKCFTTLSVEVTAISIAKSSTTFLLHYSKTSSHFVSKHRKFFSLFICVFTSRRSIERFKRSLEISTSVR